MSTLWCFFSFPGRSALAGGGKGPGRGDTVVARLAEGKEFDPLSTQRSVSHDDGTQNKVMSSFGIASEGESFGAAQREERSRDNNNNRLLMAPHLVRAQSAYKNIKIHSFYHTHTHTYTRAPPPHPPTHTQTHTTHTHTTNTCITGDGLVKQQIIK